MNASIQNNPAEIDREIVGVLARFGPLCLSQLYTILDLTPAEVKQSTEGLVRRKLIEVRDEPTRQGLPEDAQVFGLPTPNSH